MTVKKLFLCTSLLLCASSLFAQVVLSVGGGGIYSGALGGGSSGETSFSYIPNNMKGDFSLKNEQTGFGGFLFLDATYAEFSVAYLSGEAKTTTTENRPSKPNSTSTDNGRFSSLNISVLGRFPFYLGDKVVLFPLLGAEYQKFLSLENSDNKKLLLKYGDYDSIEANFDTVWIKAGCGVDYFISSNFFFRAEFLYGVRTEYKSELSAPLTGNKVNAGHGPTLKIALGYKSN